MKAFCFKFGEDGDASNEVLCIPFGLAVNVGDLFEFKSERIAKK